jgi:hypothetical protein
MCHSVVQDLDHELVADTHLGYFEYGSMRGAISGMRYEHKADGWSTAKAPGPSHADDFDGPIAPPNTAERKSAAKTALHDELLVAHEPEWFNDDAHYSAAGALAQRTAGLRVLPHLANRGVRLRVRVARRVFSGCATDGQKANWWARAYAASSWVRERLRASIGCLVARVTAGGRFGTHVLQAARDKIEHTAPTHGGE